jgi:hypothetical protein
VSADHKRLERALRSLDLVDSRLDLMAWMDGVAAYLGEDEVELWGSRETSSVDEAYDFTYTSFQRAMHFSVGWRSWPLRIECEWMLPRLRAAINRSSGDQPPFLVEIGSGPGAAAAILSAALKVPVVAIDAHPLSAGLARQFAQRTGGRVEAQVSDGLSLSDVLGERAPAAVFGMSTWRYLMPHHHSGSHFSTWQGMRKTLREFQPPSAVVEMIKAMKGADVLLAEITCSDYVAEVAAAFGAHGYGVSTGGMKRIEALLPNGPSSTVLMHFTTTARKTPNLLTEMYHPLPEPRAGLEIEEDEVAEAVRWSVEPTELITSSEVTYADEAPSRRVELFRCGSLLGYYVAERGSLRRLAFHPANAHADIAAAMAHEEYELMAGALGTIRELGIPATDWVD